MVPSFQRETATEEFLPSAVYRISDEPELTPMRRPKAIRSPGTELTLPTRSPPSTVDDAVAKALAPARRVYESPSITLAAAASVMLGLSYTRRAGARAFATASSTVLGGLLVGSVSSVPGDLIAFGRRMGVNSGSSEILYTAEGRNSSVAVSRWNDGTIYVSVNGHVEATTEIYDMRLQRMVGHLP